ncbi:AAA family ATPase [Candidatus Micrarchaeota archaeon]|nr:AAA family ATPase [Candidatus Micrarchaeota archaeon]
MLVIGLVGLNGSGKSTAAKIIAEEFNALQIGLSKYIYEELNGKMDRNLANAKGNEIRQKEGYAALAKRAVKEINSSSKKIAVVESIRHPAEMQELQKSFGKNFLVVKIEAPLKTRYDRAVARGREKESFQEFVAKEEKEMHGKDYDMNVQYCLDQASETIENNDDLSEFKEKIISLVNERIAN